MTCSEFDSLSTDALDHLVTNVLHPEAEARQLAQLGLPPVCDLEPARDGETQAQKRCRLFHTLVMLGKWFYCSVQSDPTACFDGVCDEYEEDVDACYPV